MAQPTGRQRVASYRRTAGHESGICRTGSRFCFKEWFIPVFECTENPRGAEVIRLTSRAHSDKLKYMSRLIFAAITSVVLISPGAANAQRVAGRDLLDFPLGLLAEAPALSTQMPGGLWNPATSALHGPTRTSLGFAGLTTPQELGVQLEMLAAEYKLRPGLTGSLSIAQASVSDILRTETDPQSLGGEIPYGTTLLSLGASAPWKNATFGVSARYRWGTADTEHSGAFALDGGVVVDRVAGTPVRVALSSFLFNPSSSNDASYFAAADVPVVRVDSTLVVRGGYSLSKMEGRGHENYAFGTATYRQFDLSSGFATSTGFGSSGSRWRLGFALHRAGYTAAIGREDGAAGFGASYQFLLTRAFK
jgi:hypothetical protein